MVLEKDGRDQLDRSCVKEDVLLIVKEQRNIKYVNGRRTGLVTFYVETAFYNGLVKDRYEGR
jgi:hypothetical protein